MSDATTQLDDQADLDGAGDSVADGAPAPASRRRTRRMSRRRVVVLGAVGLGAVAWLGWASPATLVEHVVVQAPRGISEESIRLASGISAADHVPAVDEEKVRLAIMTAIPAVADVELSRSLPHTITLEVTARSPLAAVDAGKGYYVMDAQGVIYDKVGSVKRIPVIKSSTDVGREAARAVLLSLPEDLRRDVRRVTARTRDDVTLSLRGGATVRWGSAEDAALKARVLAGLVQVEADRYDVSAPLLPTTSGLRTDDASG